MFIDRIFSRVNIEVVENTLAIKSHLYQRQGVAVRQHMSVSS